MVDGRFAEATARDTLKLLFPLLTPMIRTDLRKQFGRFKVFCEGSGGGAAAAAT